MNTTARVKVNGQTTFQGDTALARDFFWIAAEDEIGALIELVDDSGSIIDFVDNQAAREAGFPACKS